MKFPVVIIKDNESPIYFFERNDFGLVSKGGEIFYKKGIVYDSDGSRFLINGFDSIKKASALRSIKYFQQMYIVEVRYGTAERITLLDFKQVIVNHIWSHKKYWIKRDLLDSLEASIRKQNSIQEIIKFLK